MYPKVKTIFALVLLLCFGCHGLLPYSKEKASVSNGRIEFMVLGSQGLKAIKGAALVLVGRRGDVQTLAYTDDLGRATVPKAKLEKGKVLLVCREGYFCGAFQLYDSKFEYLKYDELSITLSPFSLP